MSKQKNTTTPIGADEVMSDDDIDGKTCPVLCFFPFELRIPCWSLTHTHLFLSSQHHGLGLQEGFNHSFHQSSLLFSPTFSPSLWYSLCTHFHFCISLCVCFVSPILFISLELWFFCWSFLSMWKRIPIGLPFPWWVHVREKRERKHLGCIAIALDFLVNWIKAHIPFCYMIDFLGWLSDKV